MSGLQLPSGAPASEDGRARHALGRPAALGVGALGLPAACAAAYPLLGAAVGAAEAAVSLIVLMTALFGSEPLSNRAFRLLRWFANRAEPPTPQNTSAEDHRMSSGR